MNTEDAGRRCGRPAEVTLVVRVGDDVLLQAKPIELCPHHLLLIMARNGIDPSDAVDIADTVGRRIALQVLADEAAQQRIRETGP